MSVRVVHTMEDLLAELRDALDLKPGDVVEIRGPQFDRPAGSVKPGAPPATPEAWEALRYLGPNALRALGLGSWDGADLHLLPAEWYNAIPVGYELVCITGAAYPHRPYPRRADGTTVDWAAVDAARRAQPGLKFTDDEPRCGCLAYGIRAAGS